MASIDLQAACIKISYKTGNITTAAVVHIYRTIHTAVTDLQAACINHADESTCFHFASFYIDIHVRSAMTDQGFFTAYNTGNTTNRNTSVLHFHPAINRQIFDGSCQTLKQTGSIFVIPFVHRQIQCDRMVLSIQRAIKRSVIITVTYHTVYCNIFCQLQLCLRCLHTVFLIILR